MKNKPNVKDFEGTVSVDADITPVTRQPIDPVFADGWEKMTTGELHLQLNTLNKRLLAAQQIHNEAIIKQIKIGITRLQKIIEERSDDLELI